MKTMKNAEKNIYLQSSASLFPGLLSTYRDEYYDDMHVTAALFSMTLP